MACLLTPLKLTVEWTFLYKILSTSYKQSACKILIKFSYSLWDMRENYILRFFENFEKRYDL